MKLDNLLTVFSRSSEEETIEAIITNRIDSSINGKGAVSLANFKQLVNDLKTYIEEKNKPSISQLAKAIHENAKSKGFYDEILSVPTRLMLTVEEIGEANSALRKDRFCNSSSVVIAEQLLEKEDDSEFQEHFEGSIKNTFEDELADSAIRIFDLAESEGVNIEKHILLKMAFNKTRPYKHGKKF